MDRLVWLAIAYVGGIAAILGSLMLLGSLLLWLVPPSKRSTAPSPSTWQHRLKLTGISLLLSLLGIGLLLAVPFPGGWWFE